MKKISTLFAAALMTVAANAQDEPYIYSQVSDTIYAITMTQDEINEAFDATWVEAAWSIGVCLPAEYVMYADDYITITAAVDDTPIYTSGGKSSAMIEDFPSYTGYLNLGSSLEQSFADSTTTIEEADGYKISNHGYAIAVTNYPGSLGFGVYAGDNKRTIGIYKVATEEEIDNDYLGEWVGYNLFQHEDQTPAYVYAEVEAGRQYVLIGGSNKNMTMHQISFNPNTTGISNVSATSSEKTVIGYYTAGGMQTNGLVKGVNIIKYSDGSAVKVIK